MKTISNERLEELVQQANWETEESQQDVVDEMIEDYWHELICEELGVKEVPDEILERLDDCRNF